jgi:hypothetical protein
MIIGLGYKARSGKDTAAAYLRDHFGFVPVAFADALKRACAEIFGLSHEQLYGDQKEVEDVYWRDTPRNILQKVGTECLRHGYADDVWIHALGRKVKNNPETRWIVTDVRFPNEANAIRDWGGRVVLVSRPSAPKPATDKHASETAMDAYTGWDYTLDNSSDLPSFYANVEVMMKQDTFNPAL